MTEKGFSMDFSDFDKKLRQFENAMPDWINEGLRNAGKACLDDVENVPPKVPHDEGQLKGTGQVQEVPIIADAQAVEVSYGRPHPKGPPLSQGGAPYAARWHEIEPGTVKFQEPGAGPKYLLSKFTKFAKKYMAIIAETIRSKGK